MAKGIEQILREYRESLLSNRPDYVEFIARMSVGRDLLIHDVNETWRGPIKNSGVVFKPDDSSRMFFRLEWCARETEEGWQLSEEPITSEDFGKGIMGAQIPLRDASFEDNGDGSYTIIHNYGNVEILPPGDSLKKEDLMLSQ